jgi:hypothetical protein
MKEIWLPVIGYEGLYSVSNLGRVLSHKRHIRISACDRKKEHFIEIKEKVCRANKGNGGYLYHGLTKDGILKSIKVHRMVAMAFIPNPEGHPQVNHKDGNKQNNLLENLEWCTSRENLIHALRTGLRSAKGEKNAAHVRTEEQVRECKRLLATGLSCTDVGKITGVPMKAVSKIKTGYTWSHVTI